jgi:hypothetical protein
MARKLKVFRTAIGFHDAYVAAPSRKAALEAWGSDADLFARGMAEEVTDAALSREPLEQPGIVIRRLRGSSEEHLAALGEDKPAKAKPASAKSKPKPKPSRAALDAAERAVEEARERQAEELAALRDRERQLEEERRALEKRFDAEAATLEAAFDAARDRYQSALDKWRES